MEERAGARRPVIGSQEVSRARAIRQRVFRSWWVLAVLCVAGSGCRVSVGKAADAHPLTAKVRAGLAIGSDGSGPATSDPAAFDHGTFDALLKAHVHGARVDYEGLARDREVLERYLEQLSKADVSTMKRAEQFALFVNAYNAYTLELILSHYPLKSIRDLPDPWEREICRVSGERVSLDFIEHRLLRVPELLGDPRVHFAVNCASVSCPPLHTEAFVGNRLEDQLDRVTRRVILDGRFVRGDPACVRVSKIFDWFAADFVAAHGSVAAFITTYRDDLPGLSERGDSELCYFDYDWSLNDVER